jgi:hypothetical protein
VIDTWVASDLRVQISQCARIEVGFIRIGNPPSPQHGCPTPSRRPAGRASARFRNSRGSRSCRVTPFISTGVTIGAALWVMVRPLMQGDISILGDRKTSR